MGTTSFSGPVLGAGDFSIPVTGSVGRTLLVDKGTNASGGFGTIQAAVDLARPGDTIFVQPGTYNETVTVSKDYITIVGAQVARYGWPDLARTTGVALIVTGQGFTARRIRFQSDDSDVVQQQANGAIYESCVFDSGTGLAATESLLLLKGSATTNKKTASECTFVNCLFRGASGVGVTFAPGEPPTNGVGSSDCLFQNCRWQSSLDGTAGVDLITADSVAGGSTYSAKNLIVKDCVFADKNKATYIDFTTANGGAASDQTGTIDGCYFADDTVVAGNDFKIVGTGFTMVGCYSTVGIFDASGLD